MTAAGASGLRAGVVVNTRRPGADAFHAGARTGPSARRAGVTSRVARRPAP
jgi:hypothetical protein